MDFSQYSNFATEFFEVVKKAGTLDSEQCKEFNDRLFQEEQNVWVENAFTLNDNPELIRIIIHKQQSNGVTFALVDFDPVIIALDKDPTERIWFEMTPHIMGMDQIAAEATAEE